MPAGDGILYVATGQRYVAEAEVSARSVKSEMPGFPVALVSDVTSSSPDFDTTLPLANAKRSFADKIKGMAASPFARTLFLDSDTFVLRPLQRLFDLLDRFDIAAAFEPARGVYSIPPVPDGFPELNTGVVLFNGTPSVRAALENWLVLYDEECARKVRSGIKPWHDQLAFTRAVYGSNLRFFVLPPEYNCRANFPQVVSGPVYVAHCRLKDPASYARSLTLINRSESVRLFNPNPRRLGALVANTLKLFLRLKRD